MDNETAEVSYWTLPRKGELLVLLICRFTEALSVSSILSYVFFQIESFMPSAGMATIAMRIGLLFSAKTAAHVVTSLVWGRLADHRNIGRKKVMIFGLLASSFAIVGYGFSRSFAVAVAWQVADGALNANLAMVRCMISELYPAKRQRARALALLPIFANIGALAGPLIGGFLSAAKKDRAIISRFPFAAPNICVAGIQICVALVAASVLTETLEGYQQPADNSPSSGSEYHSPEIQGQSETSPLLSSTPNKPLPFRRIWTPNVITTMFAQFIIVGHMGTFNGLLAVFISTPAAPLKDQHPPFNFTGGLGMNPRGVGIAISLIGFTGIILQFLIYPTLRDRFGTIRLWRAALCVFPLVYILAPFSALIASHATRQQVNEGEDPTGSVVGIWIALILIVASFVAGRTCVVPATSLLINDCTPHASVRGTVHTAGVAISNLSRSVFPYIAFSVFSYGLNIGAVELGFWFLAGLAVLSCIGSLWVWEGTNGK